MFLGDQKYLPINPLRKLIGGVRNRYSHVMNSRFPPLGHGAKIWHSGRPEKGPDRTERSFAGVFENIVPGVGEQ
jgi:hypothetical protein